MSTPAWLSFIAKMAPTVASAIGTPVAGVAVAAIEHEIHQASGLEHRIGTVPMDQKIGGAVYVQVRDHVVNTSYGERTVPPGTRWLAPPPQTFGGHA